MSAYILAEVTFKSYDKGGRVQMPGDDYAPYLRSALVSQDLAVRIYNIPEEAQFEKAIAVTVELSYHPKIDYGPLAEGLPIALVEGAKIVAEGVCKSKIVTGAN